MSVLTRSEFESVKTELKKKIEEFEAAKKAIESEKGALETAKLLAEAKAAEFE